MTVLPFGSCRSEQTEDSTGAKQWAGVSPWGSAGGVGSGELSAAAHRRSAPSHCPARAGLRPDDAGASQRGGSAARIVSPAALQWISAS